MSQYHESILNRLSKSPVIDEGDLDAAARLILEAAMEGLGINRSGIWLYDSDIQDHIRCKLLLDSDMALPEESLVLARKDFPNYFKALDEDRVIAANDAANAAETKEFAKGYLDVLGISSMLDTPIRHKGVTVGIICNEHRGKPRQWQPDEVIFSGVLSDLFGRVLNARQRLDYEQQLKSINQHLEEKVAERTRYLDNTLEQQKQLQKQLVESEKLAALGGMVSGVAHEVNTPLGVALTATTHLHDQLKKLQQDFSAGAITKTQLQSFIESATEAVDLSHSNLNKAATLIRNFKRTSADQNHFEKERIHVADYVRQVLSTLIPITKKVPAEVIVKGGDFTVNTYPGAIAQVITNFVSNACIHAFVEGYQDQAKIEIDIQQSKSGDVYVSVKDNGVGMDEATCQKIFNPFFTTRRGEGGTGLGLSIIHTLLTQNLNGSIEVESAPGKGTQFKICFRQ